ncbi:MAG TPA: AMP-binding protein [Burkholderiales bacterium]|nr:AMP-binding protein [Burkholderiales bacterium]
MPEAAGSQIALLAHASLDQVVAYRAGDPITARRMLADVDGLARRLPPAGQVINACADRYCFAVALGAAMVRGQVSLLPSDLTPASVRALAEQYAGLYLLCERSELAVSGIECVRFAPDALQGRQHTDMPAFPAERTAVIAFTSGSTGKPMPNRKTWGALARGAQAEARRFGLLGAAPAALVGTVPPQHMYGLESTVLLALRNGLAFHAARPFYPADIRAALEELPGERVLVTTPVHLRALLEADLELPRLRLAICATAPLPVEAARRFERRYDVELHEVYGFTEAGMVATRRTVSGAQWHTLPDVRLQSGDGQVQVSGGHVPGVVTFPDIVELCDEHTFLLHGRGADLVNIAGKRTSLAYLNLQLTAIEGVRDATFHLPEERPGEVVRPMAFVVAPQMTREQVLERLRSRIDPVFLPRPLYLVDALPRNATGKLPRQALAALARRCARQDTERVLELEVTIAADHPALAGHFPGDPVVPGAVLLDEVVEALVRGFHESRAALEIVSAKFLRPVRPGERLHLRLVAGTDRTVRFEYRAGGRPAATGVLKPGP